MDLANTSFESSTISASSLSKFLGSRFLDDYCPFHSGFQVHFFILKRNGGTVWGCYQQALREIAARWSSLQMQNGSSLKLNETNSGEIRDFHLQLSDRVRQEFLKELACLLGYAILLKNAIGHVSAKRRDELDFELWTYRTRVAVCRDLLTCGHLMAETVELLHVVPKSINEDLVKALNCPNERETLLRWYLSYDVKLPRPPEGLVRNLFNTLNLELRSIESSVPR